MHIDNRTGKKYSDNEMIKAVSISTNKQDTFLRFKLNPSDNDLAINQSIIDKIEFNLSEYRPYAIFFKKGVAMSRPIEPEINDNMSHYI